MIVLGVDPSLSNFGMALCDLDLDTLQIKVLQTELIKTEPGNEKSVRKNSDDLKRARELFVGLEKWADKAMLVFAEVPHGSQSARAMASYGVCVGVLASLKKPLIQLKERDLKEALLNSHTATKREMIDEIAKRHPEAKFPMNKGKIANSAEHLADAIAAVHAGVLTSDFQSAKAILSFALANKLSA